MTERGCHLCRGVRVSHDQQQVRSERRDLVGVRLRGHEGARSGAAAATRRRHRAVVAGAAAAGRARAVAAAQPAPAACRG